MVPIHAAVKPSSDRYFAVMDRLFFVLCFCVWHTSQFEGAGDFLLDEQEFMRLGGCFWIRGVFFCQTWSVFFIYIITITFWCDNGTNYCILEGVILTIFNRSQTRSVAMIAPIYAKSFPWQSQRSLPVFPVFCDIKFVNVRMTSGWWEFG